MSLYFPNDSHRVRLADSIGAVQDVPAATICGWVRRDITRDNETLVSLSKGDDRASPRCDFFARGTGFLYAVGRALDSDSTGSFQSLILYTVWQDWSFISAVFDFQNRYIRLQCDGVFDQSGTLTSWTAGNCSNTPTLSNTIGNKDSDTYQLGGSAEDVRVYNRKLSDDEILTIYACRGTDSIAYGLKMRFLFDEREVLHFSGGSDVAVDYCGNYNGTVSSGVSTYRNILTHRKRST